MEAREYSIHKTLVIELRGRVDHYHAQVLSDELHTILNTGKKFILVNLTEVTFLSAKCMEVIYLAHERALSIGAEVLLCGAQGNALRQLHRAGTDKVIKRFEEVTEALIYCKDQTKIRWPHWAEALGIVALFVLGGLGLGKRAWAQDLVTPDSNTFSLDLVLALTRESHPQIKMARLKHQEKAADVRIARSYRLPQLSLTGGYLYQSNPNVLGDLINREINNVRDTSTDPSSQQLRTRSRIYFDKDTTILGLGFAQLIYAGGLIESQMRLRETEKNAADADVQMETMEVEEQVRNLFFGLLMSEKKREILGARQVAFERRLTAAKKAKEAHMTSAIQVTEIEVEILKNEQEIMETEREKKSIIRLLNVAMGRALEAPIQPIQSPFQELEFIDDVDHYFSIAVHRYPLLRKGQSLLDAANAAEKLAKNQGLFNPKIFLFGSVEWTQGLGIHKNDTSWSCGTAAVVPLFDGQRSFSEFEKSTLYVAQSRIGYEESERKLKVEIAEALSRLKQARVQRALAQKTLIVAQSRYAEAQRAVKSSLLPMYRQDEAYSKKTEAEIAILIAEVEHYRWQSKLYTLTGETAESQKRKPVDERGPL